MSKRKFNDLADAIESLKEEGYRDLGKQRDDKAILEKIRECEITEVHIFESGTDPGDEATLYMLHCHSGENYFITLSFGVYQDPIRAKWIDVLEQMRP